MPKASQEVETVEAAQVIGYDPAQFDNSQWVTVHVEAADQLIFEVPGDTYIGVYAGHELIYPDPEKEPTKYFIKLNWTDPDGAKFTNAGVELRNTYVEIALDSNGTPTVTDKIPVGTLTRNELRKFKDVDQPSEMKSFRVDTMARNADNSA